MVLKIIIFNFDDTLISSNKHHIESFKKATNKHGLNIDEEKITKLFGKPVIEILKQTFPDIPKLKLEKIKEEKERIYRKIIRDKNPNMLKGAKNLLGFLKKSNFKTGVLSSDSKKNIELVLEKNRISNCFNKIMGSEDVKSHKPQPDGLLKIAKQLKSQTKECLYVGDSKYDMIAASKANMIGIGVASGHYTKGQLKSHGADMVFNDLDEMLANIKSGKIPNQ
ncbi:HAD family hydrolase [Nitrosopumilus sp. S4]